MVARIYTRIFPTDLFFISFFCQVKILLHIQSFLLLLNFILSFVQEVAASKAKRPRGTLIDQWNVGTSKVWRSRICGISHVNVKFQRIWTIQVLLHRSNDFGNQFCGLMKAWLPANIYVLKINNKNTRERCEMCSKLTIKTPEQRRRSGVFIVNCKHISLFSQCFCCWLGTSKCRPDTDRLKICAVKI